MEQVHAIVMTGNSKKGFVKGVPKCYAAFPDQSCSAINVVGALHRSKLIKSVTVIGDKDCLGNIRNCGSKKLLRVPQKKNASFSQNVLDSYAAIEREFGGAEIDQQGVLYLAGDSPFRRTVSIDYFLENISDEDLAVSIIPEKEIEKFYFVYKKPLLPLTIDNKLDWYKPDDMVYLKMSKFPRDEIELLYQRRNTNRLTWLFEVYSSLFNKNPGLAQILWKGWILKQYHRITRDLPDFISSPKIFNSTLDIKNIEDVIRNDFPNLSGKIIVSKYPDGYLDIDNERDFKKLYSKYGTIRSKFFNFYLS